MKRSGLISFSKAQYALPDNSHCYYILYLFLTSIDKSLEAICEMHFSVMCKRLRSGDRTREPERQKEERDLLLLDLRLAQSEFTEGETETIHKNLPFLVR